MLPRITSLFPPVNGRFANSRVREVYTSVSFYPYYPSCMYKQLLLIHWSAPTYCSTKKSWENHGWRPQAIEVTMLADARGRLMSHCASESTAPRSIVIEFKVYKLRTFLNPRFVRTPFAHVPRKRASPLLALLPLHAAACQPPLLLLMLSRRGTIISRKPQRKPQR